MNPEDAIRRLRAADRWVPMEPRFLVPSPDAEPGPARPAGGARAGRIRVAVVTAVVLALVVVGAASVIRLAGPAAPAVTAPSTSSPTPTPTTTPGTVDALPHVSGRVLATWTDASTLPSTESLDAGGKAVAVTLTCTGGGDVRYSIAGIGDVSQGCDGITTGGPQLNSKNGMLIAEHRITVHVSVTGHPRFALRVTAVPVTAAPTEPGAPSVAPTGPAVPASLRTCGAADLAPTANYERWPHFEGGLVTVTSASSTDCAIRSLPSLRYLDSAGGAIGGPAQQNGDGQTNPIRLAAHGTVYVQIELFLIDRLTGCGAKQVASLRLDIGGATTRVPVPSTPAVGKCTAANVFADGVGAASAYKPTGP